MTRIPLTLGKHYLLIDSPISFYLVDNEENSVYRPSGVWQLDTWKLLPEKYQKDHPVYTLSIEYDENKLADGKEVLIRESDIDLGDGVAGVSGQAVMLTGINDSLLPISVSVSNLPDVQKVNVQNNPTEIAVNNLPDIQKVNVQNNPTEIAVNNLPDVQKVTVQNFPDNQKVNVSNFPANQQVNVSNFPDNQKVNVSNFPANQKVNVSNFPDNQKVNVSNFPANQQVNVSNFPDIQKVNVQNNPTEIAVNNFPDVQNTKSINMPKVKGSVLRNTGLLSTFKVLKTSIENIESNGGTIDHIFFRANNDRYLVIFISFPSNGVVEFIAYNSTTDNQVFNNSFVVDTAIDTDAISWTIYYH